MSGKQFEMYMKSLLESIADKTNEWAGIPLPVPGLDLHVEPNYPSFEFVTKLQEAYKEDCDYDPRVEVIRQFRIYFRHHWSKVAVYRDVDGKVRKTFLPAASQIDMLVDTLGAVSAWDYEQEQRALSLLMDMLTDHAFKCYTMTGSFLEHSKRSGVTYLFRRLRPTIALRANDEGVRALGTLCMHPIAYYRGTWAGAMCPTDDVIAHLVLMRGDEHEFWKRSNQHSISEVESGL